MEIEVSEKTAEILFRVLTEEKQENHELTRLKDRVVELVAKNDELERLNEFGDQEWRKEKEELFHVVCRNTTQFFPDKEGHKSPVELTLVGLLRHLVQTLDQLKEHEKVNKRCQSIVLALTTIDSKTEFVVYEKMLGSIAKKTGRIQKVHDGILFLKKGKAIHEIEVTCIAEIEVAGKKGRRRIAQWESEDKK